MVGVILSVAHIEISRTTTLSSVCVHALNEDTFSMAGY